MSLNSSAISSANFIISLPNFVRKGVMLPQYAKGNFVSHGMPINCSFRAITTASSPVLISEALQGIPFTNSCAMNSLALLFFLKTSSSSSFLTTTFLIPPEPIFGLSMSGNPALDALSIDTVSGCGIPRDFNFFGSFDLSPTSFITFSGLRNTFLNLKFSKPGPKITASASKGSVNS